MKLKNQIIIFLASLCLINTSFAFALTPAECNAKLKNAQGNADALKIISMSIEDIIDCGSPVGVKTQKLSPLDIFQLITNAISYLAYALSIIAATVGILQLATSAGDKTKFQEATSLLKNAALAFIVTFTLYSILTIFLKLFGFQTPGNPPASTGQYYIPLNKSISSGSLSNPHHVSKFTNTGELI